MKIAEKISLSFLVIAALFIAIASPLFYLTAKNSLRNEASRNLKTTAHLRARHITTILATNKKITEELSQCAAIRECLPAKGQDAPDCRKVEAAIRRLQNTVRVSHHVYGIFVLDNEGLVLASSDGSGIGNGRKPDPSLLDAREGIHVVGAPLSPGGNFLVFSSSISAEGTGEILGVVVARASMEAIDEIVGERSGIGATERVYVVDKNGSLIAPSSLIQNVRGDFGNTTQNSSEALVASGAECEEKERFVYTNYKSVRVVGVREYLPDAQWSLVAEMDESEVFAALSKTKVSFVSLILAVLGVAWLLVHFVSRIIVKPIHKLQQGTEIIGQGNLDHKVATEARDEIGELSRAFDNMTEHLKQTTTSVADLNNEILEHKKDKERIEHLNLVLRAIRNVNQLIACEKNRDLLLQGACEHLIEAGVFKNAWIALVDESAAAIEAAAGFDKELLNTITQAQPEKVTEWVNSALMHSEVWVTEDFLAGYPQYRAMTIQLEHNRIRFGLLCVSVDREFDVDDEAKDLFKEVAGDIAFALYSIELEEERRRAEDALRESESKYRTLFESSHDAIMLSDKRGIFDCNKASLTTFGCSSKEEIIGKHPADLSPPRQPDGMDSFVAANAHTMKGIRNGFHSFEWLHKRREGTPFPTEVFLNELEIEGRKVSQIIVRDISERKRTEELLKRNAEEQALLLDNIQTQVWYLKDERTYGAANKAHTEFLGKEKEEIENKDIYEFLDKESAAVCRKSNSEVFIGKEQAQAEEWGVNCRGEKRLLLITKTPKLDEEGTVEFVVCSAEDITERKQAEEDLANSEKRLSQIIQGSPIPTFVIDSSHVIRYWNKACENLTGISAQEAVGTKKQWKAFYPSERPVMADFIVDSASEGKIAGYYEGKYRKSAVIAETYEAEDFFPALGVNGKSLFFSAAPLKDVKGMLVGAIEIVQDITERKRSEEVQKKLEAQLQQAQKMEAIGTLAGGVAHDFNNLLMGIQGRVSLISLDLDSRHPHFDHLKGIEEIIRMGASLTRQLLGFARGGKYVVQPTNVNKLIFTSSQMFGRTKKEIRINRNLQEDIWTVEVDQAQIEQALLNLYVNAWHAMPGGGDLYLKTENVIIDKGYSTPFKVETGKYVKMTVTDTGVGMDQETQRRIFEPFFTTREMGGGTGLGLASVYGIVKNHGGIINVYSEKGKGTTFTIYLPASQKDLAEEKEETIEIKRGKETILLVDDEEMILTAGKEMLKSLGYKVFLAESGQKAVEVYSTYKEKIDMVILDMIMPGMGGREVYDRLKEIDPNVKVLLSSGYSLNGLATEMLERGCTGFIQKPFGMKQISLTLRKVLDKKDTG